MSPAAASSPCRRATPSRRLLEDLRGDTLEVRLGGMDLLRLFSRPRVSNDSPYFESLFLTANYRPDYPSNPFNSKDHGGQWVARVRRLAQPTAQWNQICDASTAPLRSRPWNLPTPLTGLRESMPTSSPSIEPIHLILTSISSSLDQPTTFRNKCRYYFIDDSNLNGSRGVIFAGSYRDSLK